MNTHFIQRLKKKWDIPDSWSIIMICIVFSLAGMSVVFFRKLIMNFLGLDFKHPALSTLVYLIIIFPLYQVFLMVYAFILGQFSFFWEKEKKMIKWVGSLFRKKKKL